MSVDATPALARLLAAAARGVKLLAAVAPVNVVSERARLTAAYSSGGEATPRWRYAPADRREVDGLVATAARALPRLARSSHVELYAARVEELALEVAIATQVATPRFGSLARERFAPRDAALARRANVLALEWVAAASDAGDRTIASDALDPASLLSRMRAEVGARRLPFAVVVERGLAPLAAIGERSILIAAGRAVTRADVERTVLHEISGHALPLVRARAHAQPLYAIGTARGADDQEGYALTLEERGGFLSAARRRELAARHLAVESMRGGATFVEAARALVRTHGVAPERAVLACERAFRGGDGIGGGLGRERVYLEAWLRVRARLEARPGDEDTLATGRVAVDAIDAMRGAGTIGVVPR